MSKSISECIEIRDTLIDLDKSRDDAFKIYEHMYHNFWNLPENLKRLQWVRKVTSADPHHAVSLAKRVISGLEPNITVLPPAPTPENVDRANEIEANLAYQLMCANRRRRQSVEADLAQSAILYAEVAAQVIDLDYQIIQMQLFRGNTRHLEAARRYGRFMINVYNPRQIHAIYSNIMPELVVLSQVRPASAVLGEYGDLAKDLEDMAKNGDYVLYNDLVDYDNRVIWVEPWDGMGVSHEGNAGPIEIWNDKNPFPTLNWAIFIGGSTLEDSEEHKRQPLLYSIYTSGAWETQNILKTLYASEAISHAGSPRYKTEGANPAETQYNFMDPMRDAKVAPGNTFEPMQPPEIDRALQELDAMLAAQIDSNTVSRILEGGNIPAGIAFATLNLATLNAVGALKPYKWLTERALEALFEQMLLWVKYTKKPLEASGYGYKEREDKGRAYMVDPDELDPRSVHIRVELRPDVPLDRQQQVNTAAMAIQTLGYSQERALESIGENDPKKVLRQRYKEDYITFLLDKQKREAMMRMELGVQTEAMLQQQMAQASQMAAPGVGMPPGAIVNGEPVPGGASPGGAGFNPAAGGLPPAMANPGATREMVTGMDRMGVPIAE